MKNILMCLQQLDIGGVETAVLTMCKGYKELGYNVYVAAKDGVYTKELEELDIEILNIDYEITNHIFLEKKEELKKFCLDRKIDEIHIHQYPCVAYWLPVCLELNIPYIAYVHSIVKGAPEWFMNTFSCYKTLLNIFFSNASRVLCISNPTKEEIESLFEVEEKKYKIINNCLYFEDFKQTKAHTALNTFGIASRFSEEKEQSIKKAIDLFKEYNLVNKKAKLLIAGSGEKEEILKDYANDNKNISFLGPITDMSSFYNKLDVFMGLDRCILEATATKVLPIISSYNGNLSILTKDNIKKASEVNFSGKNLENDENILNKLNNIDKNEYKKIVDSNYKFINEKYNILNNLEKDNYKVNYSKLNLKLLEIADSDAKIINSNMNTNNNHKRSLIRRVLSKIKRVVKRLFR